jgi:hypothetical protein
VSQNYSTHNDINLRDWRYLSPLIHHLSVEVDAYSFDIVKEVALDVFAVKFKVDATPYVVKVYAATDFSTPLDFDDDSFKELIAEIKLRHF